METLEMNFKFELEENYRSGDPLEDEIASYVVKDDNGQSVLVVESHIALDEEIDGLVIHKVSIPVDPDEPQIDVPATQLARILATLAGEGSLDPGEPGHLDSPGEYTLRLEEPYKITSCYYQKKYEAETNNWLQEFLVKEGTIARILEIVDAEEGK